MYERECPECGFKTDEDICLNCGATVKPSVYVVKAPSGIPVKISFTSIFYWVCGYFMLYFF